MFDLKNRVAVITGGSSGLGAQMARGFAAQGADLVLMARGKEKLDAFAKELEEFGGWYLTIECDVTDAEAVNCAANEAERFFEKSISSSTMPVPPTMPGCWT